MSEVVQLPRKPRHDECEDCHGGPGRDNSRVSYVAPEGGVVETWHLPDCASHTAFLLQMEESARRVKEQDAWARAALPAAEERMLTAAAALSEDAEASPFVAALLELVRAQTEVLDRGSFVVHHRWAEILDRHFPAEPA
ncbi:hypothetical protein ACEZCY_36095 [Streptacidiphilus sp. N1-12]|uniref:PARP-type domain-containing protein n=1 Tax=Streptacidiphilus alkalitolerans TaxID=3342712 RepID=A0ABV6WRD0_9ACTN